MAMVIITTMKSAVLVKELKKEGWVLRSGNGSDHVLTHPTKPGHVTVPHPKKDLGKELVKAIRKQAGLSGG